MAKTAVHINGRDYEFVCDNGQEAHLKEMGKLVDRRVKDLAQTIGQIGEARLLAMAALLLADELSEAYKELDAKLAESAEQAELALTGFAGRIEQLAARLHQA